MLPLIEPHSRLQKETGKAAACGWSSCSADCLDGHLCRHEWRHGTLKACATSGRRNCRPLLSWKPSAVDDHKFRRATRNCPGRETVVLVRRSMSLPVSIRSVPGGVKCLRGEVGIAVLIIKGLKIQNIRDRSVRFSRNGTVTGISHRLTREARDRLAMTLLRLLAVLDVHAGAMSPGMATRHVWRRAPHQDGPFQTVTGLIADRGTLRTSSARRGSCIWGLPSF